METDWLSERVAQVARALARAGLRPDVQTALAMTFMASDIMRAESPEHLGEAVEGAYSKTLDTLTELYRREDIRLSGGLS